MHLIQQHTINVDCSSQPFGKELHQQLGGLLEKEFYPKLDLLFEKYECPNQIWSIDCLELNLPTISPKNWKNELIQHSLNQIEAFLQNNKPVVNTNQSRTITDNNRLIPKSNFASQLLFQFLVTGTLPENSISKKLDDVLLAIEISEKFSVQLIDFFKTNPSRLLRWIMAIPDFFKDKITPKIDLFPFQFKSFFLQVLEEKTMNLSLNKEAQLQYSKLKKTEILKCFQQDKMFFLLWIELMQWIGVLYLKSTSKSLLVDELIRLSKTHWNINVSDLIQFFNWVETVSVQLQNDTSTNQTEYLKEIKKQLTSSQDQQFPIEQDCNETKKGTNNSSDFYFISNSGLVVFHPFLQPLFEQLNLIKDGNWKNNQSQHKAVLLTQYLVTGTTTFFENELVLNKILCGLPIEDVVNIKQKITKKEKEKCQNLLEAVLEYWTSMSKSSIEALRETFLIREGKLDVSNSTSYELWVEEKGYDILLAQLPWGIGMIKTPWMNEFLTCHWN
ncbi:MAG: hypothetical protein JNJ52_10700 [Flavobacterium sp.]|nr:hypothetical protein [Flavobacterium sp.]